ncbi:MAG: hypothetical protein Q9222_003773 [Ikaeria aurantiellina]
MDDPSNNEIPGKDRPPLGLRWLDGSKVSDDHPSLGRSHVSDTRQMGFLMFENSGYHENLTCKTFITHKSNAIKHLSTLIQSQAKHATRMLEDVKDEAALPLAIWQSSIQTLSDEITKWQKGLQALEAHWQSFPDSDPDPGFV